MVLAVIGTVLVAGAFVFGVLFGRKNPKKVNKAVDEVNSRLNL